MSDQTLPYLDHLLSDIRNGHTAPLYWGKLENIRIAVVRCRNCNLQRADDGTRCAECGVYQYASIQAAYEKWQAAGEMPSPYGVYH